jgi:hypothetical protein
MDSDAHIQRLAEISILCNIGNISGVAMTFPELLYTAT